MALRLRPALGASDRDDRTRWVEEVIGVPNERAERGSRGSDACLRETARRASRSQQLPTGPAHRHRTPNARSSAETAVRRPAAAPATPLEGARRRMRPTRASGACQTEEPDRKHNLGTRLGAHSWRSRPSPLCKRPDAWRSLVSSRGSKRAAVARRGRPGQEFVQGHVAYASPGFWTPGTSPGFGDRCTSRANARTPASAARCQTSRTAASPRWPPPRRRERACAVAQKDASGSRPATGLRWPRGAPRRDKRRLPLPRKPGSLESANGKCLGLPLPAGCDRDGPMRRAQGPRSQGRSIAAR